MLNFTHSLSSFFQDLKEEFRWWARSPSLWWVLPLFFITVSLIPWLLMQLALTLAGIDFAFIESASNEALERLLLNAEYPEQVRQMTLATPELLNLLDLIVAHKAWWEKSFSDYLALFFIPALQFWGCVFPPLLISPLALGALSRDRKENLFSKKNSIQRASRLFSKLIFIFILISLLQILALILNLYLWTSLTQKALYFSLQDTHWLSYWVLTGASLCLFSSSLCWKNTFISRQHISEYYLSFIPATAIIVFALLLRFVLGAGAWATITPLCLVLAGLLSFFIARFLKN